MVGSRDRRGTGDDRGRSEQRNAAGTGNHGEGTAPVEALQADDDEVDEGLITRYVEAFEQYNIAALLALFQENGSLSMPPFTMWVQGGADLAAFYQITRSHCVGSRLMPVRVNGNRPAVAQYVPSGEDGLLVPWAIHVLELSGGRSRMFIIL